MSTYPLADVHATMDDLGYDISVFLKPWVSPVNHLHPTQCRPDMTRIDITDSTLSSTVRSLSSCYGCERSTEGRYWTGLQMRLFDAVAFSNRVNTACNLLEDDEPVLPADALVAYRELLQHLHPDGEATPLDTQLEQARLGVHDWAALPDSAGPQAAGRRPGDEYVLMLLSTALDRWSTLAATKPAHLFAGRHPELLLAPDADPTRADTRADGRAGAHRGRRVLYLRNPGVYINLAGFTGEAQTRVDVALALAWERPELGRWDSPSGDIHYLFDYDDPALPDVHMDNLETLVEVVTGPRDPERCLQLAEMAVSATHGDAENTFPVVFRAVQAAHA